MVGSWLAATLALAVTGFQASAPGTAADAVTLRDDEVVLGQVAGEGRFGALTVLVRRAWAEANVPGHVRDWERVEAARVRRARLERRARLFEWRRERAEGDGTADPVLGWIELEVTRVSDPRPPRTPLMAVELPRSEVRAVVRRDPETARLLRLAWRHRLAEPEATPVDALRAALQDLGALDPNDPARVEDLLPVAPEAEALWRARRGATEASVEPGLRFVLFRELVVPEWGPGPDVAAPGNTTELLDSPAALSAFAAIQGIRPADPVRLRLAEASARGRVGAIASRVELAADSDTARAESTLWVRLGTADANNVERARWTPYVTRRASARTDEPIDPSEPVAAFTPIRTALLVLESVAGSPSPPGLSVQRQAAGAAAQRALGRARAALEADLAPLVLPVEEQGPSAAGRPGSPRPASPGARPSRRGSSGRTAG
jgi:hypothetical protein